MYHHITRICPLYQFHQSCMLAVVACFGFHYGWWIVKLSFTSFHCSWPVWYDILSNVATSPKWVPQPCHKPKMINHFHLAICLVFACCGINMPIVQWVIYYFEGQGIITAAILMKVLTTSSTQTSSDMCVTGKSLNIYAVIFGTLTYQFIIGWWQCLTF